VPSVTMVQALNEALRRALSEDDRVLVLGEDVGRLGGVFRVTDGLQAEFGENRVLDTPLAESGIIGACVGLAMNGFQPVAEMQFSGFSYPAFEQIVSHCAKYRFRTRGRINLPITIRIPSGGGIGAVEQHSESPESYYVHTAGLKVVIPSNASDAFTLLLQSIADPDPVVFLEPMRRYWSQEETDLTSGDLPGQLPLGRARLARDGSDITIITYGAQVPVALEAAEQAAEDDVSCAVIDLRSLAPLDMETVLDSVRATGRALVVHEAPLTLGLGAEIAARAMETAFYSLQAPVLRVGGFDVPYPPAKLEDAYLPDVDRVLDGVEELLRS